MDIVTQSRATLESCAMNTSCKNKSPLTGRFRGVFLFLLFTLLSTLTAGAQDIEYYDLWLGSTQVTSANKDNILNQVDADGNPTAKFDGNRTLTLNSPTISGSHNNSKIYADLWERLRLVGTYHMSGNEAVDYGIYSIHEIDFRHNCDFVFYGEKNGVKCLVDLYTGRDISLEAHGNECAFACGGLFLYGHKIVNPKGGYYDQYKSQIYEADGSVAKHVIIRTASVPDYELWLGNTQVFSLNQDDIFGDGKASYDPTTKTLTLNNPTIPGIYTGSKIYAKGFDLTIKGSYHQAESESWNAFCVEHASLTLDGDFTLYGNCEAIAANSLTVKSGTLTASGLHETGDGYGYSGNTLTIEENVNYIELQGGSRALYLKDGNGLHLADGYEITTPENGIFQNNVIYDGTTVAQNVVIQNPTNPIQFYDLWVGGKHVSNRNQNDILGDGKASFDPTTNTLMLTGNPTIAGTTNNSKIYSKLPSLTVTGSYHMTEAEGRSGIYSESGPLTLNGDFTFLSKGDWLTDVKGVSSLYAGNTLWAVGNITLNGNITVQGQDVKKAAIYTKSGNITVQGGNLQASATNKCAAWCGGTFTAKGNAESITLEGSPGAIHASNLVINNADGQQLDYYEPENPYFDSTWKSVYERESSNSNNTHLAARVVLKQPQAYNLWIGSTRVNEANCNDILGDGKARFNPVTSTLTLDNPTISGCYLSNGYESKIAAEGMDLTLKGVYRMEEVDNGAVVGLQVSGGTLTTEGDFTFQGLSVGVDVTDNMSVKGHLHAVGRDFAGIRYSGTDADKGLTLLQGFIGETKVELDGGQSANTFSNNVPCHIGQSGLTLAEPDGGSIDGITYWIKNSSDERATHAVLTLKGTANGQGTEQNPYRINSREEWAAACEDVANGVELSGKFVALNNDIKAYKMMGTALNPFRGTFDGYGHTLTSSINQSVQGTAPFHTISGATIRDLKVAGTIKGQGYSSGLVGYVKDDGNLIQNCEVSASIGSSGGYNGGIVGHAGSYTTTLDGCVFRGGFFDTSGYAMLNNGTFVGWDETGAQLTLNRCLDLSKSDPIGRGLTEPTTATNIYSTFDKSQESGPNLWTTIPQLAYKVTGSDVNLTLTGATGAAWNGNLYAAQGETLSFTVNPDVIAYTSTAGTFTQNYENCTLVMPTPGEDVTILNANASSFDIALATVTNGTAVVKNASKAGAVVGIHITPNTYYLLDEVTVEDANNNAIEVEIDGEYGFFTMPNSDVTVSVTFKKQYSFENGVLHLLYGDFNIINHLGFDTDVMEHRGEVLKVIADEGVRFTQSCSQLFKDFTGCTEMDLSKVNTAGLVTTSEMFSGCTNLQKLNMTGWETYQINYMNSMFEGCSSLREIDLSGFHVSEGTSMTRMFGTSGISKLTLPAGMAVTKEMELNKGRTYTNTYEGSWSNGTWSYSGWTVLGANGEVVSSVEADDNNSNFTYAVIPAPPVPMTFVWKDMPDDFILELPDGQDNSKTIADWNGVKTSVKLTGRKLYKDGGWNTICLPFMLGPSEIINFFGNGTDFRGLDLYSRFNAQNQPFEGGEQDDEDFPYQTGFDEATGTLRLYFTPQNSLTHIMPGEPYLIKWDNTSGIIESPTFSNVTIDISSDDANVSKTVTSQLDGKVSFVGTYDPISFTSVNRSVLFMGGGSNLYYPDGTAPTTIGPFRAYFQLNGISAGNISATRLFFGDGDDTQGIVSMEDVRGKMSDVWYDLNGRKLSGTPTCAGLYIVNGKKVIIK